MLECVTPSLQREPTWEVDTFGDQEKAIIVELFAQCDADGSGVIEYSELKAALGLKEAGASSASPQVSPRPARQAAWLAVRRMQPAGAVQLELA